VGGTRPGDREPATLTLPRLMLVTDRGATGGRDLVEVVSAAVTGGVGLVQVRERDLPDGELEDLLRRLLDRLRGTPARVLVNGRPALAAALGIGLHLPATAPPPPAPPPALFGRAAHSADEARRALAERPSYLVVGPVFPTVSKPGHPGAGVGLLAAISRLAAPVPIFAIGGVAPDRVPAIVAAGAYGLAVRSAILSARDPRVAARGFRAALTHAAA
jgi:thiamine-phosphate diphosphorylase